MLKIIALAILVTLTRAKSLTRTLPQESFERLCDERQSVDGMIAFLARGSKGADFRFQFTCTDIDKTGKMEIGKCRYAKEFELYNGEGEFVGSNAVGSASNCKKGEFINGIKSKYQEGNDHSSTVRKFKFYCCKIKNAKVDQNIGCHHVEDVNPFKSKRPFFPVRNPAGQSEKCPRDVLSAIEVSANGMALKFCPYKVNGESYPKKCSKMKENFETFGQMQQIASVSQTGQSNALKSVDEIKEVKAGKWATAGDEFKMECDETHSIGNTKLKLAKGKALVLQIECSKKILSKGTSVPNTRYTEFVPMSEMDDSTGCTEEEYLAGIAGQGERNTPLIALKCVEATAARRKSTPVTEIVEEITNKGVELDMNTRRKALINNLYFEVVGKEVKVHYRYSEYAFSVPDVGDSAAQATIDKAAESAAEADAAAAVALSEAEMAVEQAAAAKEAYAKAVAAAEAADAQSAAAAEAAASSSSAKAEAAMATAQREAESLEAAAEAAVAEAAAAAAAVADIEDTAADSEAAIAAATALAEAEAAKAEAAAASAAAAAAQAEQAEAAIAAAEQAVAATAAEAEAAAAAAAAAEAQAARAEAEHEMVVAAASAAAASAAAKEAEAEAAAASAAEAKAEADAFIEAIKDADGESEAAAAAYAEAVAAAEEAKLLAVEAAAERTKAEIEALEAQAAAEAAASAAAEADASASAAHAEASEAAAIAAADAEVHVILVGYESLSSASSGSFTSAEEDFKFECGGTESMGEVELMEDEDTGDILFSMTCTETITEVNEATVTRITEYVEITEMTVDTGCEGTNELVGGCLSQYLDGKRYMALICKEFSNAEINKYAVIEVEEEITEEVVSMEASTSNGPMLLSNCYFSESSSVTTVYFYYAEFTYVEEARFTESETIDETEEQIEEGISASKEESSEESGSGSKSKSSKSKSKKGSKSKSKKGSKSKSKKGSHGKSKGSGSGSSGSKSK